MLFEFEIYEIRMILGLHKIKLNEKIVQMFLKFISAILL